MTASPTTLARVAGALLGVGGAAALIVDARPSASFATLPAKVSFAVAATGELAVTPAPPRPVLAARGLEPGGRPAAATFTVRNQTGRTLDVDLRAGTPDRDLDGLLRVRVQDGATTLSDATLQALRTGMAAPLRLRPGASRRVSIAAWLPAEVTDGHQGRSVDVVLTPKLEARG